MGKYRTLYTQVAYFDGAGGSVHESVHNPKRIVSNGNGQFLANQHKPGLLPVRSEIEWQKWKEWRFKRGPLKEVPLLLIITLLGCLLSLPQSSYAKPATSLIGSVVGVSANNSTDLDHGVKDNNTGAGERGRYLDGLPLYNPFYNGRPKEPQNCTPPSSDQFPADLFTKVERQSGAIAVHVLVSLYMLYALLLVCEDYFVPAIDVICEELHIPHNIAGATLMAISTSAPELFTNVIGTFVTKGDLGVGTIVGSAVFNVLAVGGAIGIGTNFAVSKSQISPYSQRSKRKGVPLDWWSLTRDSFYYILSVVILIGILFDGRVYWQEALLMLVVYVFYIVGMCYDSQCKGLAKKLVGKVRKATGCEPAPTNRRLSKVVGKKLREREGERTSLLRQGPGENSYGTRHEDVEKSGKSEIEQLYPPMKDQSISASPAVSLYDVRKVSLVDALTAPPEELDSTSVSSADSGISEDSTISTTRIMGGIKDIIAFPLKFVLSWTIPNCKQGYNRKWAAVSLAGCVGWIAGLSYVISWMVCIIGETFGIPDSVSGLTFLAAGTSLPEVISSVIVARQGLGSMGLSNSVGSNTFDVLVCLGLPWLIESAILTASDTNYIEIQSGGLTYSSILLIATFVLLYLLIAFNSYTLDTKVGVACVILYLIFITFACMLEMNIFFPVNLPPC